MKLNTPLLIAHIMRWINVYSVRKNMDRKICAYCKENPRIPIIIGLLQCHNQNYERPIYDYIEKIM